MGPPERHRGVPTGKHRHEPTPETPPDTQRGQGDSGVPPSLTRSPILINPLERQWERGGHTDILPKKGGTPGKGDTHREIRGTVRKGRHWEGGTLGMAEDTKNPLKYNFPGIPSLVLSQYPHPIPSV